MSPSPPVIEITDAELEALTQRVEQAITHDLALPKADLVLLLKALTSLAAFHERLADQKMTLAKLRKLAGLVSQSEALKDLMGGAQDPSDDGAADDVQAKTTPDPEKKRPKRKPPSPPTIDERCHHRHETLQKGDRCPECGQGTLYKYQPVVRTRVSGQSPLHTTQHIVDRLRCNACGAYFNAPVPESVTDDGPLDQHYGNSARALMGIIKFHGGVPCYRQQSLQQLLGAPVSASTMNDQCGALSEDLIPISRELMRQAAHGTHYQIADTAAAARPPPDP